MTTQSERPKTISVTQALCPTCKSVLAAQLIDEGEQVFLVRDCPQHGEAKTYIWPSAQHYHYLMGFDTLPAPPPVTQTTVGPRGCPHNCGICAIHKRRSALTEIELTQRCNLACPVCFMSAETLLGADGVPDPSLEEIRQRFAEIAQVCGLNNSIQLTGGEPSVRPDLTDCIRAGRDAGFKAIELNTNGVVLAGQMGSDPNTSLLDTLGSDPNSDSDVSAVQMGSDPNVKMGIEFAKSLKSAGLSGIYLQFDGITEHPYEVLRGAKLLDIKLRAIKNAAAADLQVVLAMTIVAGLNDNEIGEVLRFALSQPNVVGLALQPAFASGRFGAKFDKPYSAGDVVLNLAKQSAGLIEVSDIWPLGCSHPLCDMGTLLIKDAEQVGSDPNYLPVTRSLSRDDFAKYFNPEAPQGSIFFDIWQGLQLNKTGKAADFSDALSLIIMNYMDANTFDLQRVQNCSMFVQSADGRTVPFCAYHL